MKHFIFMSFLVGMAILITSCSGSGSGSGSGGGLNNRTYAVSLFCATGSPWSQCQITWSNGTIAPAAYLDQFGYPSQIEPKGNLVESEIYINEFGNTSCLKLWENGGVRECSYSAYVGPWEPSDYESSSDGIQGSAGGNSASNNSSFGSTSSAVSSNVSGSPSLVSTTTTEAAAKPFQIGEVKTYINPGGSIYQQYFTYLVNANPNGIIPKSLCLFIDGQPYVGVIGPSAAYPSDSSPKQNCVNPSEFAISYKYPGDFGFDFSLKEYPGAIAGDKHEVTMKWEFDSKPSITTPPRILIFSASGRWTWTK